MQQPLLTPPMHNFLVLYTIAKSNRLCLQSNTLEIYDYLLQHGRHMYVTNGTRYLVLLRKCDEILETGNT